MTIQEALEIKEKCDPADCDCDNCPIGKTVEYFIADPGVSIKSTVCGFLLWLEDIIEESEKEMGPRKAEEL